MLIVITLTVGRAYAVPQDEHSQIETVVPAVEEAVIPAPAVEPVSQPEAERPPEPIVEMAAVTVSLPVGCEKYTHIIAQYDWNINTATAICQAESSGNPMAIGDNYPINGLYAPSCGLFQVRTLASRPSCSELQDPSTNIAWAYKVYTGQGWRAWSVCKTKVSCY